jgi:hypothetical protein
LIEKVGQDEASGSLDKGGHAALAPDIHGDWDRSNNNGVRRDAARVLQRHRAQLQQNQKGGQNNLESLFDDQLPMRITEEEEEGRTTEEGVHGDEEGRGQGQGDYVGDAPGLGVGAGAGAGAMQNVPGFGAGAMVPVGGVIIGSGDVDVDGAGAGAGGYGVAGDDSDLHLDSGDDDDDKALQAEQTAIAAAAVGGGGGGGGGGDSGGGDSVDSKDGGSGGSEGAADQPDCSNQFSDAVNSSTSRMGVKETGGAEVRRQSLPDSKINSKPNKQNSKQWRRGAGQQQPISGEQTVPAVSESQRKWMESRKKQVSALLLPALFLFVSVSLATAETSRCMLTTFAIISNADEPMDRSRKWIKTSTRTHAGKLITFRGFYSHSFEVCMHFRYIFVFSASEGRD